MPRKTSTSRLPQPGDEVVIRVRVTRVGRNSFDTDDAITFRIPGHDVPVTVDAARLRDAAADA